MEIQEEERRSSSSGLLWLALIACIGGFFYYGGASLLSQPFANVAPLVNSSSCDQIAAGYQARAWALEACQDAVQESIPGRYFARQIYQESGFNPDVVSASGDIGIE